MSLDNLVGISLERITPDINVITRLLLSAMRSLSDSGVTGLSDEVRK